MKRRNMDDGLRSLRRAAEAQWTPENAARYLIALQRSGATEHQIRNEILALGPPPAEFVSRALAEQLDADAIDTRQWTRWRAGEMTQDDIDQRMTALEQRLRTSATGVLDDSISVIVLTDDPTAFRAAIAGDNLETMARQWGPQGPGVYGYGFLNRKIVGANSSRYWSWKTRLTPEQRLELAGLIAARVETQRDEHYVSGNEADFLLRCVRDMREPGEHTVVDAVFSNLVSSAADQPYNMAIDEMLAQMDVELDGPERLTAFIAGRFASRSSARAQEMQQARNAWIDSFGGDEVYREMWCRTDALDNLLLASLGFHGSFVDSGYLGTPGFCVWDARTIRALGRFVSSRAAAHRAADDWTNPNPAPGDLVRSTANPRRRR